MTRRDFLALAAAAPALAGDPTPADITLRISEINAEIGPGHVVRTTAYNGEAPGPLLRMTAGTPATVEVIKETRRPELVHWHGLHLPPQPDGPPVASTP